jgi:DNA-binding PadR family transcriptional regulator
MRKNEIDIIILGMMMDGPMHGYQLKQRLKGDYYKHFVNISIGSLYTRLSQFEAEGLIEGKREMQDKVPDKKVFYVTAAGKKRLAELVATPIDITDVLFLDLNDFLTHVLFFDHISKKQRQNFIKPFYDYVQGQLRHGDVSIESFAPHGIRLSEYQVRTLGLGMDMLEDMAKYLEGLMEKN